MKALSIIFGVLAVAFILPTVIICYIALTDWPASSNQATGAGLLFVMGVVAGAFSTMSGLSYADDQKKKARNR